MPVDDAQRRLLNLISGSPAFVRFEGGTLKRVASVPADAGMCTLSGTALLANGTVVESVLVISASSGELHANYWWVDGMWVASTSPEDRRRLGLAHEEVYPYDWSTTVPLEVDVFHDDLPRHRPRLP